MSPRLSGSRTVRIHRQTPYPWVPLAGSRPPNTSASNQGRPPCFLPSTVYSQVSNREERAVGADAVDDISRAAGTELPLVCEVVAHDHVRFMQLNAEQRAYASANSHNHVGREEGRLFSSSLTESKKGDDSRLLVVLPMKRICNQDLIVGPQIDRHSRAEIRHGVLARLELPRHVLCWTLVELGFGIV